MARVVAVRSSAERSSWRLSSPRAPPTTHLLQDLELPHLTASSSRGLGPLQFLSRVSPQPGVCTSDRVYEKLKDLRKASWP